MRAWRIVRERWASNAFNGEGAARTGGRWNSRGVRVVYASPTLALAALEVLVHADPANLPGPFLAACAELPDDLTITTVGVEDLPRDWRTYPAPRALQQIGDDWVAGSRTAVLQVPSAIIPLEHNLLLNPAHPDFQRIRLLPPVPFAFDPRLGVAR